MHRQKWTEGGDNLVQGDVVYFKLTESPLGADWRIGLVEHVKVGRDGVVHEVDVAFKHELDGTSSVVQRPARNLIKLFHLDDTPLMSQIKEIEEFARDLLKEDLPPFKGNEKVEVELGASLGSASSTSSTAKSNLNHIDFRLPEEPEPQEKSAVDPIFDNLDTDRDISTCNLIFI